MLVSPTVASPFKFLDAYTADDTERFFGRDREQNRLLELLARCRLVLVYGQSGTGKTSLVQCGLAKDLPASDYFLLLIRRKTDLRESVLATLSGLLPPTDETDPVALVAQLARRLLRPVYLIFDQLEELYISGDHDEQAWFGTFLLALVRTSAPCKVLLVIREDFLAPLYPLEDRLPGLFDFRLRVEPMNTANLRKVIIGTLGQIAGLRVEEESKTVDAILKNNQNGSHSFQLPYLQVYLDRLWRRAQPEQPGEAVTITPALVEQVGRVDDVLELFLAEQKTALAIRFSAGDEKPVATVLEAFVTYEGTRQSQTLPSLGAYANLLLPLLENVVDGLERSRILRREEDTYELAHDSLAKVIDSGRSAEQRQLNDILRRLKDDFREWTEKGHADDLLLSPRRLTEIRWKPDAIRTELARNAPDHDAIWKYVEISQTYHRKLQRAELEQQQRRNRRLRLTVAGVSALAVLALMAVGLAWSQWQKSTAQSVVFLMDKMDAVSALIMSAWAHDTNPNDLTTGALYNAFYNGRPYENRLRLPSPVQEARFSPDGTTLLLITENRVYRWDCRTQTLLDSLPVGGAVLFYDIAGDQMVVLGTADGKTGLWPLREKPLWLAQDSSVVGAEFSPSGQRLLTRMRDERTLLRDRNGKVLDPLPASVGGFGPDDRTILLREQTVDHAVQTRFRLWDWPTKQERGRLQTSGPIDWFAFTPDGRRLLFYDQSGVYTWQPGQRTPTRFLPDEPQVDVPVLAKDGKTMVIQVEGRKAYFCHPDGSKPTMLPFDSEVRVMDVSPDGQTMLTLSNTDRGLLQLWNRAGVPVDSYRNPQGVKLAEFSPDGKTVLCLTEPGDVYLWPRQDPRFVTLPHPADVQLVRAATDGSVLLTATATEAFLWDRQGRRLAHFPAKQLTEAGLSADGQSVVLNTTDSSSLWQRSGGRGPWRPVLAVPSPVAQLSPDGRTVLYKKKNQTIHVRNRQTGRDSVLTVSGMARFSPDGKRVLLFSGADKRVLLVQLDTGVFRHLDHLTFVRDAYFSSQETILTQAGTTLGIWTADGNPIAGFKAPVHHLAVPERGGFWVTALRDRAMIWPDPARIDGWLKSRYAPQQRAEIKSQVQTTYGITTSLLDF
ncbi:NACHT and WD repeat domain-containing protein [Larkinella sp. VNQ87]|uniref:NACHT and WD repeat domain-containing protein n=1 Tax=Larkinella sp. VNQ87 TaxID=3400921 RepID=UPI003BFBE476